MSAVIAGLAKALRRRPLHFLVPLVTFAGSALAASHLAPKKYRATAELRVDFESLHQSAADQRLVAVRQEILGRTRVERVIEEVDPYPTLRGRVPMSYLVEAVRGAVAMNVRGRDTFTVECVHRDPTKAMQVVNRLVTLFIEETTRARTAQVTGAADFVEAQLEEARLQLEANEESVRQYKESHLAALPEELRAVLATLGDLQREHLVLSEALESAEHQVEILQKNVDVQELSTGAVQPATRARLVEARARVAILRAQRAEIEQRTASLQTQVKMTPRVEQLTALTQDYVRVKENYLALLNKKLDLQLMEHMKAGGRAERFRVVEPAARPERPIFPRRTPFLVVGTSLGILVGLGSVFAAGLPKGSRSAGRPGSGAHPTLSPRYTDILCPSRVWRQTPRFAVTVRLTRRPADDAARALHLDTEEPVHVQIQAPRFSVLSPRELTIEVPALEDSRHVVFELQPVESGPAWLKFDFLQRGHPLGTVTVPIEVTADEVSYAMEPRPGSPLVPPAPDVPPPDLLLYIRYDERELCMLFELLRHDQPGRLHVGHTFEPVKLRTNPANYAEELYASLGLLAVGKDPPSASLRARRIPSVEELEQRLRNLGQKLWREVIPAGLKSVYRKERQAWAKATLLILSDDPWLPWELVWPYDDDGSEDAPWGVRFRLTRWLRGDTANGNASCPTTVHLKHFACIAPRGTGLTQTMRERDLLLTLIKEHGIKDVSPAQPTWQAVTRLLAAGHDGGYDWLHAASHGSFDRAAPDLYSAIWLENEEDPDGPLASLTPDAITGTAESHVRRRHPAFVFNACRLGSQGWGLTRIEGWAGRLVSTGASLFVGPLWEVDDEAAFRFSAAFYQALLTGETLGEASRIAREEAKRVGGPTWLAYSVYGHPNARVALG